MKYSQLISIYENEDELFKAASSDDIIERKKKLIDEWLKKLKLTKEDLRNLQDGDVLIFHLEEATPSLVDYTKNIYIERCDNLITFVATANPKYNFHSREEFTIPDNEKYKISYMELDDDHPEQFLEQHLNALEELYRSVTWTGYVIRNKIKRVEKISAINQ